MKQLIIVFLILLFISCNEDKKPNYSVINGTIENTTADSLLIRGTDFELTIPISETGKFSDTLHLKNNGFFQLYVGREQTQLYLERGMNLTLNLDANEFDETLKFSGDLANPNNFLAQKYLWTEKNLDYKELHLLNENDFLNRLDLNQNSMDSLYSAHKILNKNFKTILEKENEYNRAIMIENYEEAHRYFSGNQDYQVDNDFYSSLENINYSDTLEYRNSVAYQNLLDVHFNRLVNNDNNDSEVDDHALLFLKKIDSSLPDGYAKDNNDRLSSIWA